MDDKNKQDMSWQERWDTNGWKPKPKIVINLDDIYKDGKLFGYDIYFKKAIDYNGEEIETGPWASIKDGNKSYEVQFFWDWEHCFFEHCGENRNQHFIRKNPTNCPKTNFF